MLDKEEYLGSVRGDSPNVARAVYYEMAAVARAIVRTENGEPVSEPPHHLKKLAGDDHWQDPAILREAYDALYPEYKAQNPGRSFATLAGYDLTSDGPVAQQRSR